MPPRTESAPGPRRDAIGPGKFTGFGWRTAAGLIYLVYLYRKHPSTIR
jgi:hypothetical protein